MAHLGIDTAQNVHLQFEVASVGDRLLAFLIDLIILVGWSIGVSVVLDELSGHDTLFVVVLLGIPWTFYHLLCEQFMDGQSLGKRLRRIKVVRRNGQEATLGAYLLRWVLRPIDSFYGLGLVVILFNGKGQRLGDLAANTTVVNIKKRVGLEETLLVMVAPDHVVRYPQAIELSDGQARYMKQVLNEVKGTDRGAVLAALGDKLRQRLSIGHELSDVDLIRALLEDYVHLTGRS